MAVERQVPVAEEDPRAAARRIVEQVLADHVGAPEADHGEQAVLDPPEATIERSEPTLDQPEPAGDPEPGGAAGPPRAPEPARDPGPAPDPVDEAPADVARRIVTEVLADAGRRDAARPETRAQAGRSDLGPGERPSTIDVFETRGDAFETRGDASETRDDAPVAGDDAGHDPAPGAPEPSASAPPADPTEAREVRPPGAPAAPSSPGSSEHENPDAEDELFADRGPETTARLPVDDGTPRRPATNSAERTTPSSSAPGAGGLAVATRPPRSGSSEGSAASEASETGGIPDAADETAGPDDRMQAPQRAGGLDPDEAGLTRALPRETPPRTGRWLVATLVGAVALAVLLPLAVAALRTLVDLSA